MMRIAVLGTTLMTEKSILEFAEHGWEIAAVINLPKNKRPLNSIDLRKVSDEIGARYYETDDLNAEESQIFLYSLNLDYIFSTWPYILSKEVLNIPRYFVIGSHPTQLPYNRGRHSLHWLISMGIKESYMSFFVMDDGIDSGNILVQEKYSCVYDYGIRDVYKNMIKSCRRAICQLCNILEKNPEYRGVEQNEREVNYWRKRNVFDIIIDFRMSAADIERLVKSFNYPYECAILLYKSELIRIANAKVLLNLKKDEEVQRIEAGKVIQIKKGNISVKASDQIIELDVLESIGLGKLQVGTYIHPPAQYIMEELDLYRKLQNFINISS